jgi:hypothetical protein
MNISNATSYVKFVFVFFLFVGAFALLLGGYGSLLVMKANFTRMRLFSALKRHAPEKQEELLAGRERFGDVFRRDSSQKRIENFIASSELDEIEEVATLKHVYRTEYARGMRYLQLNRKVFFVCFPLLLLMMLGLPRN